jgi:hypothetical protein
MTAPLRELRPPVTRFWDDGDERLERRLGPIAAELIVAGEAAFRQQLVETREWNEELVQQVRAAVASGGVAVSPGQLARWEGWALGQADRLDPVLSGQVLAHLVVPELDAETGLAGDSNPV